MAKQRALRAGLAGLGAFVLTVAAVASAATTAQASEPSGPDDLPVSAAAAPAYGLPGGRPTESPVTFPNDPGQSGWYPDQTGLSPAVVGSPNFGQLFSTPVDGQVYAAPVVSGSTLFAASETNHLYGLDATTGAIRWTHTLGPSALPYQGCTDLTPDVGITSTPAVDTATGTAYVVWKTFVSGTSGPAKFVASAIRISDGALLWSVDIQGTASNDPAVAFSGTELVQRPALFLMDGVVYAGFGGNCDTPNYRGWIAGISTAGSLRTLWTDQADRPGPNPQGGIWQGAGSFTSDHAGQLLVVTANGDNPPVGPFSGSTGALGQSILRLEVQGDGSLQPIDSFSPADADALSAADLGLGSGAAELLPSEWFGTPTVPNLAVTGSKHGSIYVVDRSFLGGRGQGPSGGDGIVQRFDGVGAMWSTPAFWVGDGGYFYQTVAFHGLQAYKYSVGDGDVPTFSLAGSSGVVSYGSSSPIVTSNGANDGSALVWMVARAAGGDELRAYDAVPSGGVLQLRGKWSVGTFAKFNRITVSGNHVFLGTRDGHILGFGARNTGATGEYTPLTPARILDTRTGLGRGGDTSPVGPGQTIDVPVAGQGGIPADPPLAVVLNVTATEPTGSSFLRIWPTGSAAVPAVSNLNYEPGQTVPNLVTVPLNALGSLSTYNNGGSVHVIFDVVGYYATATGTSGSRYHSVAPARLFDTRGTASPVGGGEVVRVDVRGHANLPASGITAVTLNVTATEPTASSYVTVFPGDVPDGSRPTASNLNVVPGQTVPNLVTVRVPTSGPDAGVVAFYNNAGSTHLVADVVGYYDDDRSTGAGRFLPAAPTRLYDSRVAGGPLGPGGTVVLGPVGPAGMSALVLNVTATEPTDSSFLAVFPAPGAWTGASNLNVVPGQTVPNGVVATLGPGGQFAVLNNAGSTQVVVDVFGGFTGATFGT